MKVIAFNGSARKGGNTSILINLVFGELQKEGLKQSFFNLQAKRFEGVSHV